MIYNVDVKTGTVNLPFLLMGDVNLYQDQLYYPLESAEKLEIEDRRLHNFDHPNNRKRPVRRFKNVRIVDVSSMTQAQIEEQIQDLYEKVDDRDWRCKACDYKTENSSGTIRQHVKTHLDGQVHTCDICNEEFRTKPSLREHTRKYHKFSS